MATITATIRDSTMERLLTHPEIDWDATIDAAITGRLASLDQPRPVRFPFEDEELDGAIIDDAVTLQFTM